ncbi:ABC transporter substrate-binding protein [Actinotalea sp. C106]|uniref:ABC transporter substrate-binding protein n=1 Tax=Actinotalea sp. C106 TaxID=2908644 RepID=UPI0020287981|nr:ABC transporter substrate-binding protein [Actinotalea sp. C106]
MGRAARWIGAGAAVALLAACSPGEGVDLDESEGEGTEQTASGETLVAAIAGEPDQLDPHRTSSYFSFQVLENVFDTLVEPDENLEMQPALAESWEVSEDQLTWTFDLREGVEWHDGTPFTAEDVVFSYTRIIDEELANAWRFASVTEVTAPDESTVVIEVSAPTPNLLPSIGGFKGMAIVQEENVESGDITTAPVGTGPFSLADYSAGDSIDLTANPDWWGGAPQVSGVTFRFVPEPTTAVAEITSGDVHWTDNVPPQQVEQLEGDDAVVLGAAASNDYWYLAANQGREPFDDVRVRQALSYAIDRDAIAQVTQYGNATVNQLAIPETSAWHTEYDTYSHDVDQAASLLEEAGVDGLEIDMLVTSEYPETVTAAQAIASQLEPLGVTVTPREVDFATWLDEQGQGNYDVLMLSWLGNIDPDDFYYAQHHSTGSFNFQGYANTEVDALLDEARTETDEDARRDLYAAAARQIADDASYIYLYNPDVVQLWVPELEDYEARGDGAIRFRDVSITG